MVTTHDGGSTSLLLPVNALGGMEAHADATPNMEAACQLPQLLTTNLWLPHDGVVHHPGCTVSPHRKDKRAFHIASPEDG